MRDKHILLIHFVLNFRLVFILVRALLFPRRALALQMCRRQGSSWPGQLTQKKTRKLGEQNQRYPPTPPHLTRESFLRRKSRGKASNLRGGEKILALENSISPQVNSSLPKLDQSSFVISPLAGIFPP